MTERASTTRACIVEAAARRFSEHGFHDVRIEQIAQDAHVSVGSIYRYFAGKPGLMFHFISEGLDALEADIKRAADLNSALARVHAAGDAYFRFAADHPLAARYAAVRVLEPDRGAEFEQLNAFCSSRVRGIVMTVARDLKRAMDDDEIPRRPIDETMIFLWALANGTAALILRRDDLAISPDAGRRGLAIGRRVLGLAAEHPPASAHTTGAADPG